MSTLCALSIFCAVTRVSRGRWVNVVRGDSYTAGVVCQLKFLRVLKFVRGDSYIAGVVCQLCDMYIAGWCVTSMRGDSYIAGGAYPKAPYQKAPYHWERALRVWASGLRWIQTSRNPNPNKTNKTNKQNKTNKRKVING